MTRVIAAALLLAVLSCGKHAAPPPALPTPLALADDAGHLIVTLAPDDTITDATGTTIGHVDWTMPVVIIGTARETLAFDLDAAGISIVTTMGTFHVKVDPATQQLQVDDKPAGKLSGFVRTKDGWRRLAALVVAIPMLPTRPERTLGPTAPPSSDETAVPPPPPPPPPGPAH